jgi:nucleotide-binding universal stress UspA family protein
MDSIVVGIDTELPSRTALDWVVERAALLPARVRLVTVVGDRPFSTKRAERDIAAAALRLATTRPDTPVESKLVEGAGIAQMLCLEAADADLLVIGHHRQRIMRSMLAGALPTQVATLADCPVIIVPHDWQRRFGKVVVGVEFDGSSDAALEFGAQEAAALGRSLDIVQVTVDESKPGSSITPGQPDVPATRSAEVSRLVERARSGRHNLAVRTFTTAGDPDRILRAHGRDAALVVVGSHGHGAIDAVLRGSRTYTFMNWSKAPLAVVPVAWRARTVAEAPA